MSELQVFAFFVLPVLVVLFGGAVYLIEMARVQTSRSKGKRTRKGSVRGDYGFARVRDQAFDAVGVLWRRRRAAGMKQVDVAEILGRDEGWVSRQFRGPGNWTLRTFGELVEALNGELELAVFGKEDPPSTPRNYDAYTDYGDDGHVDRLRNWLDKPITQKPQAQGLDLGLGELNRKPDQPRSEQIKMRELAYTLKASRDN